MSQDDERSPLEELSQSVTNAISTLCGYVGQAIMFVWTPIWALIGPPIGAVFSFIGGIIMAIWVVMREWFWVKFMLKEPGWSFNFIMAHLLFWAFGVPTGWEYGYDDTNLHKTDGNIPSGPSGSGVVIISMLLVMMATTMFGLKVFHYNDPQNAVEEEEKAATE
eukprot:CAMPEP_0182456916 /NCGR_PEP_ID=MMETSP1319-20130603/2618_1 /TAXON_ID=172717 /ORGANISM="Bolidomonas pacifica, Strain RCC208" /LENGTH=163 /DNA_ID=CAMNT_0024655265 /DNA_START=38 /DNA_END=529 /DNA_ORIENTATION=+